MAKRVIQFPVRNAFPPSRPETDGSLARDSQDHAHRIAAQVEAELARKAERMATGLRLEFDDVRKSRQKPKASLWQRWRETFARMVGN